MSVDAQPTKNMRPGLIGFGIFQILIGAAILFSIIVSLLAGLYPASRAAKLDPVQTLKYE